MSERPLPPDDAPEAAQTDAARESAPEAFLPPAPEATPEQRLAALLDEAEREKAQFKAMAQRAQADLENYRKRADEQQRDAVANAAANTLLRVLPALDDLERALALPAGAAEAADGSWLEGFRLIERKLGAIIAAEGLERIEALGAPFNPFEHEVVGYRHDAGRAEGDVLAVTRQGYRANGRVLRPAQVVVQSRAVSADAQPDSHNDTHTKEA